MPTFDTYLYANGALRLTRHGDRAGGTVLMHVPSGQQFTVPDYRTNGLMTSVEDSIDNPALDPAKAAFDMLAGFYRKAA